MSRQRLTFPDEEFSMAIYDAGMFTVKEINRLKILQDVIDRNLRPGQAAEMLGITPRHCSRLLMMAATTTGLKTGIGPVRHWSMSTMPPVV